MSSTKEFDEAVVPEHCPGPSGDLAGKAAPCQGCPNKGVCASGAGTAGPDPAIEEIRDRLLGVKRKVVILSGKGGVGKSTLTTMLARALAAPSLGKEEGGGGRGAPEMEGGGGRAPEVGLVDVDICGPSIPRMLGVEGEEVHQSMDGWSPVQAEDGVSVMSIGFLLGGPDDAVVWRGPRKNGMIKQFLRDVNWGPLDWMLFDTPPGTSDEHLSLVTLLAGATGVDGAILVGTPQDLAILDVRKEVVFCRKVGLKILGLVENMAGFQCPNCQGMSEIFRPTSGGMEALAKEMGVPFLGRLPLDPRLARACDEGKNFLEDFPDSALAKAYFDLANKLTTGERTG